MHIEICRICNKEFQCNSSRKYCSDICRNKANVLITQKVQKKKNPNKLIGIGSGNHPNNKGKNSKSYKTGSRSYQQYKKEKCEICGSVKFLLVHHKDKNRNNNELYNLQTLCKKCHQKIHRLKRDDKGRFIKTQVK